MRNLLFVGSALLILASSTPAQALYNDRAGSYRCLSGGIVLNSCLCMENARACGRIQSSKKKEKKKEKN